MKRSHRRAAARGIALAAALVALGFAVAADEPSTSLRAASSPSTPSSTAMNQSTTTSTSPAATTSTALPTSTTASTVASTTTSVPRARRLHAEHGTLSFDLTIEPAYPRAGEIVEFRIDATDTEGGIFAFGFIPGDRHRATKPSAPIVDCAARDPNAAEPTRQPSSKSTVHHYSYRTAGEQHFSVMVATGACSRAGHYAELSDVISVLAGGALSNGPQAPKGWVFENAEGAPEGGVLMSIGASDPDGVVRRVTVDWGDGSPPTVLDVPMDDDCLDEPTAYPSSGDTHGVEHVYATPGTYTVTATSVSTGCAGNDEQSVTVTGSATV